MEKQINTEPNVWDIYKNFKNLVGKRINLENLNQQKSVEYLKISKELENLFKGIKLENLNSLRFFLKSETDNLTNIYRSDIDESLFERIKKELDVNYGCLDIVDKFVSLKNDKKHTR